MKTVIMAGGKGTRIASVNDRIPKPLIPVDGTPVLERELKGLHAQGFDFVKYFNEEGITVLSSIHCVNLAQGLKEPVVYWSATGQQHLLDATDKFFKDMPRFISYPTGMFGGDECLRDNDPTRGSELCTAVEFMYSLEEMMKITGNPFYAEYLERITFNALPTQMSKANCSPSLSWVCRPYTPNL